MERFWNWYAANPALASNYFSRMAADALLEEVSQRIRLRGTVVDLGAGPGYLVERLLDYRSVQVLAIDLSADSMDMLRRRFGGHPRFLGAEVSTPTGVPVPDALADVVLLIETVEHLEDGILASVLSEAHRVLRRGGYVVVTTPNEEDLRLLEAMCPNCGCVFHTVQHVRSWSAASLSQTMAAGGFISTFCRPTLFSIYRGTLLRRLHRVKWRLAGQKLPNLLYIGTKA